MTDETPKVENYAIEVLRYEYYRVRMDMRITERNEREHCVGITTKEKWAELREQERQLKEAMDFLEARGGE